jgi:hypothetical protein
MTARQPFIASGPFVARTDFTHGSVVVKAGAPFDAAGMSSFDVATLWRAMLIDVAPRSAAPAAHETAHAVPVKPPKPPRTPRTAARS